MGGKSKKKDKNGLGKSLIRDRFHKKSSSRRTKDTFLHTSELNDGFEWGRLNLHSVTESNQLEDFLATAELAGQEFTAEKDNIQIMSGPTEAGVPNAAELRLISDAQLIHKSALRIPRRPKWYKGMTSEELDSLERHNFLEWRRSLSLLMEEENILVTPFERNLECWRQLWRVIERSDIIVQIVDSRDPLMFRCEDLEAYVKEVKRSKVNVLLINKSDLLTPEQRDHWAKYFNQQQIQILFWSAKIEAEKYEDVSDDEENNEKEESSSDDEESDDEESDDEESDDEESDDEESDDEESDEGTKVGDEDCSDGDAQMKGEPRETEESRETIAGIVEPLERTTLEGAGASPKDTPTAVSEPKGLNSGQLCDADRLLSELRRLAPGPKKYCTKKVLTIGLVGYPNVGKSSTINAILKAKRCKVSATPGKTKHFQTIYIDKSTMLCDCPGLVMPSFANTKADMILNGILPIDEMRDHKPATNQICHRIPRENFEALYSVNIRRPKEGEDPNRPPTDLELLNAYGAMRGFMTPSGVPDNPKGARVLLKDYVTGKLLYSCPPPGMSDEVYRPTPILISKRKAAAQAIESQNDKRAVDSSAGTAFDQQFFHERVVGFHVNNNKKMKERKPGGSKKREKTRRLFAHLDKHDAY